MEFSKTDMTIMVAAVIMVVSMSFVFPALGLGGDEANASEVPEFNITTDRFDFVDEFPENPGAPSQGYIRWDTRIGSDSLNQRWLHGDTQGGVEIVLLNDGNASDPEADIGVLNWTSGTSVQDEYLLQNVGDIETHDNFSYLIRFEYDRIDHHDDGANSTMVIRHNIIEQPSDNVWYARIPLVGQIVGAGEQLAGVTAYGYTVIWWAVATAFEMLLNFMGIFLDVITFGIGIVHFLLSTYAAVIGAASGWPAVFLTIPSVLFMLELGKLSFIGIAMIRGAG